MQNVLLDTQAKLLKSRDFSKGTANEAYVDEVIENATSGIRYYLENGISETMNNFN